MENRINNRLKELNDLKSCAEMTNKKIDDMIVSVGWTIKNTKNSKILVECPFDSSHHLSEKNLTEHLENCQWKAEGYREWDIPLSEPVMCDIHSSITFDEQMLEKVLQQAKSTTPSMQIGAGNRLLPRTSNRIFSDFTPDERKAVYEYVVTKTIKPIVGEDLSNLNNLKKEDSKSSYLELLAHERDLKRRRAKHRGVHTNKKSHIEILREVINQQMDTLKDYVDEKRNNDNQNDKESDKNEEIHCTLHSAPKEIRHNKNETTSRDNPNKKNLEEKTYTYNHHKQHYNDSHYNRDYYKEKSHSSDNRRETSLIDHYNYYEHDSKYSNRSSRKHDKSQERFSSDKYEHHYEKSRKHSRSDKNNDEKNHHSSKSSIKYDKIHERDKSRKYEISKHSTRTTHRNKTSTNKKN